VLCDKKFVSCVLKCFFQLPPVIIKSNYYYLKSTGTKEQTGGKKGEISVWRRNPEKEKGDIAGSGLWLAGYR